MLTWEGFDVRNGSLGKGSCLDMSAVVFRVENCFRLSGLRMFRSPFPTAKPYGSQKVLIFHVLRILSAKCATFRLALIQELH